VESLLGNQKRKTEKENEAEQFGELSVRESVE
jgi:hypothetical protein